MLELPDEPMIGFARLARGTLGLLAARLASFAGLAGFARLAGLAPFDLGITLAPPAPAYAPAPAAPAPTWRAAERVACVGVVRLICKLIWRPVAAGRRVHLRAATN